MAALSPSAGLGWFPAPRDPTLPLTPGSLRCPQDLWPGMCQQVKLHQAAGGGRGRQVGGCTMHRWVDVWVQGWMDDGRMDGGCKDGCMNA